MNRLFSHNFLLVRCLNHKRIKENKSYSPCFLWFKKVNEYVAIITLELCLRLCPDFEIVDQVTQKHRLASSHLTPSTYKIPTPTKPDTPITRDCKV